MSEYQILTVFAAFAFAYSLIATRLEKTPINGALVYVAVGILFSPHVLGLIDLSIDGDGISQLAEIALAICLFTDLSNADLSVLRRVEAIPARLFLIGLPLTIALDSEFASRLPTPCRPRRGSPRLSLVRPPVGPVLPPSLPAARRHR